jgi:hypothetical protein
LLLARNGERSLEIPFRFRPSWLRRFERDFSSDAIDFGLVKPLFRRFERCRRFANTPPSVVKSANLSVGLRQMK